MALKKKVTKIHNLTALVDELGELKAQIAMLEVREKEIKTILCSTGETLICGQMYQAAIVNSERISLDTAIAKTFLSASQIIACQRITPFTTVRVSARSE